MITSAQTGVPVELGKLLPGDNAGADQFGYSVSIDGNRALVGANQDDENGNNSGSVYVFEYANDSWTETAKLTASDGTTGDLFGSSVYLDADRALVGAYRDDDQGNNAGSAYVFEFSGGNWIQTAKLVANDAETLDLFGASVALDGDWALIGAPGDSGSAYFFEYSGGNWIQAKKISASDAAPGSSFGFSVSINSDQALVGAYGPDIGAAYVFDLAGGNWTETTKLMASDGTMGNLFGYSVFLRDTVAMIGAPGDDNKNPDAGAIYIYKDSAGNWPEAQKILTSDTTGATRFGFSIFMDDNRALFGVPGDNQNGTDAGAAYIFQDSAGIWIEAAKLVASDGAGGDLFGSVVSLSGDLALIGAYRDDDNGLNSGAAYGFDINGPASFITYLPGHLVWVYPNPFQSTLLIDWSGLPNPVEEIKLMSPEGRWMLSKAVKSNSEEVIRLHTSDLPPGLYLLEVRSQKGRVIKRMIRQ